MSDRVKSTLYVVALVVIGSVLVLLTLSSPTREDRVARIGDRVKCPVCQSESIANSPSQMARDMMSLVRERVEAGVDDETILAELLGSFSGAVLLDPPVAGNTMLLWLAPLAALLVGGVVITWWMRQPTATRQVRPAREGSRLRAILFSAAAVALVVSASLALRDGVGPASGVADLPVDLDQVSNETLEAVIAANVDNPEIDGMRLALAGRYMGEGDYGAALDHYLKVAESSLASSQQRVLALIQMGRIVWEGNGEADLAVSLFDQALDVDPSSAVARYNKAIVVWCGYGDFDSASDLLADVVAMDASPELTSAATSDLTAIGNGEGCA